MLFQADPDKPFILRADASDRAIGSVLEQRREGALTPHGTVPVAFFSRKLGKSQLNWTPREKETYAVVEALKNGPVGLDFSLWSSPLTQVLGGLGPRENEHPLGTRWSLGPMA